MAKRYGNLINRFMEESLQPEPVVGMPATITMWSDRTGATVTKIINSRKIEVTKNKVTKWQDFYGVEFGELEGAPRVATRKKDGSWQLKGGGAGILLGTRQEYRDPSF